MLLRRVEIAFDMIKCNFQKVKIMTQTNIKDEHISNMKD